MTLKNALIGLGAAAGIAAFVMALRKTHGLPRYVFGIAGMAALSRLGCDRSFERNTQRDVVDFNSDQSFPASDPPGWTAG